ncbi:CPBP family intramembrane glutamic endopeptidase [Arthrobacter luteolus]|uniref:CPBP family intramembrane glutamic endopeptidase n=1 Tax=Arthrobacter luteolus TaxID=98672 RepID=UPI000829DEA8|nr:CPBP family intramembrane glutamic endopeptidase [Arthrobacter luteolus]
MEHDGFERERRVVPRVWIGLVIWAGYLGLVYIIQSLSGIPYDTWGDSAGNLFFGAGLSLIVATVLLALTTTLLGWWHPALYDRNRSRHRWPIFIPILMAVAAAMNLAGTDWSAYSGAFLAASLTLGLVGFTEEIVNRGLLLVGFRTRLSEGWVWFLTSAMFGLTHFVNIALGADAAGTVQQVFFAFLAGTVFYILRRTTGSLWAAMLLHGLWDFSVFATGVGTPGDIVYVANVIVPLTGLLGLVCVRFVISDAKERISST